METLPWNKGVFLSKLLTTTAYTRKPERGFPSVNGGVVSIPGMTFPFLSRDGHLEPVEAGFALSS